MERMMTISVRVPDELIEDILTTAFEGGINYWCGEAKPKDGNWFGAEYVSEVLTKGGVLELFDLETDDIRELHMDWFLIGFQKVLSDYNQSFVICDNVLHIEDYDANFADAVVQMAVFGEVVYG